jgi:peroxiredoxin Q/BCP
MLCDESKKMLKSYKVWGLKKFMGREYKGIHRISYLINEKGIIEKVFDKVKTKSHAIDVLNEIK